MHLLLFLPLEEQLRTAAQVDKIISAEFPTAEDDLDRFLMDIVTSVMVHGPCGELNPGAKCIQLDPKTGHKKCCKRFPKPFQSETVIRDNGYPLYCRRDNNAEYDIPHPLYNGQTYRVKNEWVVPHSPYLLCKYHAHINVENCGSVQAIKYIHKYIYKSSDRATAEISGVDKISRHLNGRYIGPAESMWNMMEFLIHEKYPPVQELMVHLPEQQVMYFKPNMTEEEVQAKMDRSRTTLMAFFDFNAAHEDSPHLLYQEFPESCI